MTYLPRAERDGGHCHGPRRDPVVEEPDVVVDGGGGEGGPHAQTRPGREEVQHRSSVTEE